MSLAKYRWHIGATPSPLAAGERCPVLFRDVGLEGLELFFDRRLDRLAGPLSPIVYMRSADWVEPYTDFAGTGRLVILDPAALGTWHSGLADVYVAPAAPRGAQSVVAYVPGDSPLARVERKIASAATPFDVREALGGKEYDQRIAEDRSAVETLIAERGVAEQWAGPVRGDLQSGDSDRRGRALEAMRANQIGEHDLTACFHHIEPAARARMVELGRRDRGART